MKNLLHLLSLAIVALMVSCSSPEKLYHRGQYESVFTKLNKNASKGKLDADEKFILMQAVEEWNKDKEAELNAHLNSRQPKDWRKGMKTLGAIEKTQKKIKRYAQLQDADLPYINTSEWKEQFGEQLYTYYYDSFFDQVNRFRETARQNDIRKAYDIVGDMREYTDNQLLMDSLEQVCIAMGHRKYRVIIENQTIGNYFTFDRYFADEINLRSDRWNSYYYRDDNEVDFDLVITLEDIDEDGDSRSNTNTYTRRVIDYYETQVDTAGVSTQVPVYKEISANVSEITYEYIVETRADVEIYESNSRRRLQYDDFRNREEEIVVVNYLESGDRAAVPNNIQLERNRGNNYNYNDLVQDALEQLANNISRDIPTL